MWRIKQKYEIDYPERLTVLQKYSTRIILRSVENGDFLEAVPVDGERYSFIDENGVKYIITKRYNQGKNIYCDFDYKNTYQDELDNGDIVFRQIVKNIEKCVKKPQKPLKIAVFEGIMMKTQGFVVRLLQEKREINDTIDISLRNINITASDENYKTIVLSNNCSDIKIGDCCKNIVIGDKCQNIFIDVLCENVVVGDKCKNVTIGHCCKNIELENYAGQGGGVVIKHNSENIRVQSEIGKFIKI